MTPVNKLVELLKNFGMKEFVWNTYYKALVILVLYKTSVINVVGVLFF